MKRTVMKTSGLEIGYPQNGGPKRVVARDLDLELQAGELVCLIGPNGAGKTTLLRTITGLHKPLSGEVILTGRPLGSLSENEIARRVSLVLTTPLAVGQMRVEELVGMGRFPFTDFFDRRGKADRQAVDQALKLSDAEALKGRLVLELSDGERQHVMLARALAQEPQLMVLDEPTAFLDLPGRVKMMMTLRKLAHNENKAILSSTHDLDLALQVADWIWLMDKNGQISQGAPEDLVLHGDFSKAFNRQGVEFDPDSGKFKTGIETYKKVILHGQGIEKFWTMRALIRAGYDVLEEGSAELPVVEAFTENGRPSWRLEQNGGKVSHSSIYSLLYALNEDPAQPTSGMAQRRGRA